jgi:hypothetical protein
VEANEAVRHVKLHLEQVSFSAAHRELPNIELPNPPKRVSSSSNDAVEVESAASGKRNPFSSPNQNELWERFYL